MAVRLVRGAYDFLRDHEVRRISAMTMERSSPDVLLVLTPADSLELREELTRNGVPFDRASIADRGLLGFDFGSLVPLVFKAGAFAGLATVLTGYFKHRK